MATREQPQKILITGAGGFLGQALAGALLKDKNVQRILLTDLAEPNIPPNTSTANTCQIHSLAADLTIPSTCSQLLSSDWTHIYLLHGIMSGAAESNLDLGLKVNVDSMRYIADTLRQQHKHVRVIFPSSLAVFGPAQTSGEIVTENTITSPQSSYGAEKAMTESLLNDFSRRGLIDARILRLPTIIVRPGNPTGAASSFFSGIIREPLNGEVADLPVDKELRAWVCSSRTVIRNLVIAKDLHTWEGSRIVNLPGKSVTVRQMLEGLEKVGGKKAIELVKEKRDEQVERIVGSWPADFDTTKAKGLGFLDDVELEQGFRDYVEDYM